MPYVTTIVVIIILLIKKIYTNNYFVVPISIPIVTGSLHCQMLLINERKILTSLQTNDYDINFIIKNTELQIILNYRFNIYFNVLRIDITQRRRRPNHLQHILLSVCVLCTFILVPDMLCVLPSLVIERRIPNDRLHF